MKLKYGTVQILRYYSRSMKFDSFFLGKASVKLLSLGYETQTWFSATNQLFSSLAWRLRLQLTRCYFDAAGPVIVKVIKGNCHKLFPKNVFCSVVTMGLYGIFQYGWKVIHSTLAFFFRFTC